MMTERLVYTVPIGINAHNQAKKFSLNQGNLKKAKQVYLNTLAVWSVNTYVNILGWPTSLETSDSWSPLLNSLMNIADLKIPNYGKLECIRKETNSNFIDVPAEVWTDRIAYIVVELSQSLREAKILGFVSQLNDGKILLSNLQSLEKFPACLEQQKHKQLLSLPQPVKLSQWREGVFERSWRQPDTATLPSQTLSFFSTSQLTVSKIDSLTNDAGITRVKLIELESSASIRQIALLLNIKSQKNQEVEISVKASPTYICPQLPYGLEIMILDERSKQMMQAQAKKTESIEFRFCGKIGDEFGIQVVLDRFSKIENFII